MPLIDDGSSVSEERLAEIYREHVESIQELAERLLTPPAAITDAARWRTGCDLARDTLAMFPPSEPGSTRTERVRRVNLTYDLQLAMVEYLKTTLDLPKVPRARPS